MHQININLRKIKPTDLNYFLKWWKDKGLINLTSGIYEKSDEVLTGYFLNMLKNKRDHHYMILLNKKTIGHIALTHKTKNIFEIHIVIGEKKHWGKGYGTIAIKKALRIAFGKLGYKKAYLEVRPDNSRAIVAYKICGFIKKGLKKYPKNKYQPIVLKMELIKS